MLLGPCRCPTVLAPPWLLLFPWRAVEPSGTPPPSLAAPRAIVLCACRGLALATSLGPTAARSYALHHRRAPYLLALLTRVASLSSTTAMEERPCPIVTASHASAPHRFPSRGPRWTAPPLARPLHSTHREPRCVGTVPTWCHGACPHLPPPPSRNRSCARMVGAPRVLPNHVVAILGCGQRRRCPHAPPR